MRKKKTKKPAKKAKAHYNLVKGSEEFSFLLFFPFGHGSQDRRSVLGNEPRVCRVPAVGKARTFTVERQAFSVL